MPVQVSYPGVYVREIPSGVRTITGVSTSVAAFIGMTERGPLDTPTRVLSFADFERNFGSSADPGEMADQVRQFFQNGGQQAFITRVANGAASARVRVDDETGGNEVLALEAVSAGASGESLRIEADYDAPRPEGSFNLTVSRLETDAGGTPQVVETELLANLDMNPDSGRYALDVIAQESGLIAAELGAGPPPAINGFSVAGVLQTATTIDRLVSILGGSPGAFQISVDGSPFVTARVDPADASQLVSNFQDPVNLALAPFGRQVTVALIGLGGYGAVRIQSTTVGGSVAIQPAASDDIAVAMQMGTAQGGLEVGGFAPLRLAPSGLFSILGTGGGNLTALSHFIALDPDDVSELTISDASGGGTLGAITYAASSGQDMSFGALGGNAQNSLRNVQENLRALADQISASAAIDWTAEVQGFRIILTPGFGDANSDLTAMIATSDGGGGGEDIGTATAGRLFSANPNVRQYRPGGYGALGDYENGDQAGLDGTFPVLANYERAWEAIDREVDLFNLMILPRGRGQGDADRLLIWSPASAFCQEQRAFLIVDPPAAWRSAEDALDGTTGIPSIRTGLAADHAAIYWPRVRVVTLEGGIRTVDPAGTIGGLMARIDASRGVWKAPAGIEASLRGVRRLEHALSDLENGNLNQQAVNALRSFPAGIVSWGARTVDGFDNSGNNDYRYVPVRRLALFIGESLFRGLRFAVFEPNDEPLWAQIRLAAGAFMNNLFRQGAFQGQMASDAYFVRCDAETTTQNDINLGVVNVVVGFAPLRPAEFVVITIQQKAGQVQV